MKKLGLMAAGFAVGAAGLMATTEWSDEDRSVSAPTTITPTTHATARTPWLTVIETPTGHRGPAPAPVGPGRIR